MLQDKYFLQLLSEQTKRKKRASNIINLRQFT